MLEHLLFFCHKMVAEEIAMEKIWMTARSLTQAQKMMRSLSAAGINAVLQRARGAAAAKGCGYMIGVENREEKQAREVLFKAGVPPMQVFSQRSLMGQEAEHDLF